MNTIVFHTFRVLFSLKISKEKAIFHFIARMSQIFGRRAGSKCSRAEPSRAEKPPAQAESELSRAELSSPEVHLSRELILA